MVMRFLEINGNQTCTVAKYSVTAFCTVREFAKMARTSAGTGTAGRGMGREAYLKQSMSRPRAEGKREWEGEWEWEGNHWVSAEEMEGVGGQEVLLLLLLLLFSLF
jgi:hypothetical protein